MAERDVLRWETEELERKECEGQRRVTSPLVNNPNRTEQRVRKKYKTNETTSLRRLSKAYLYQVGTPYSVVDGLRGINLNAPADIRKKFHVAQPRSLAALLQSIGR